MSLQEEFSHRSDEESPRNEAAEAADEARVFFRYSVSDDLEDLIDVMYCMARYYHPQRPLAENSGRYPAIRLESDPTVLILPGTGDTSC